MTITRDKRRRLLHDPHPRSGRPRDLLDPAPLALLSLFFPVLSTRSPLLSFLSTSLASFPLPSSPSRVLTLSERVPVGLERPGRGRPLLHGTRFAPPHGPSTRSTFPDSTPGPTQNDNLSPWVGRTDENKVETNSRSVLLIYLVWTRG